MERTCISLWELSAPPSPSGVLDEGLQEPSEESPHVPLHQSLAASFQWSPGMSFHPSFNHLPVLHFQLYPRPVLLELDPDRLSQKSASRRPRSLLGTISGKAFSAGALVAPCRAPIAQDLCLSESWMRSEKQSLLPSTPSKPLTVSWIWIVSFTT